MLWSLSAGGCLGVHRESGGDADGSPGEQVGEPGAGGQVHVGGRAQSAPRERPPTQLAAAAAAPNDGAVRDDAGEASAGSADAAPDAAPDAVEDLAPTDGAVEDAANEDAAEDAADAGPDAEPQDADFSHLTTCAQAGEAMRAAHDAHRVCNEDADCDVSWSTSGRGPDSLEPYGHCVIAMSDPVGPAVLQELLWRWDELGCDPGGCNDGGRGPPACRGGLCVILPEHCPLTPDVYPDASFPECFEPADPHL